MGSWNECVCMCADLLRQDDARIVDLDVEGFTQIAHFCRRSAHDGACGVIAQFVAARAAAPQTTSDADGLAILVWLECAFSFILDRDGDRGFLLVMLNPARAWLVSIEHALHSMQDGRFSGCRHKTKKKEHSEEMRK